MAQIAEMCLASGQVSCLQESQEFTTFRFTFKPSVSLHRKKKAHHAQSFLFLPATCSGPWEESLSSMAGNNGPSGHQHTWATQEDSSYAITGPPEKENFYDAGRTHGSFHVEVSSKLGSHCFQRSREENVDTRRSTRSGKYFQAPACSRYLRNTQKCASAEGTP